MKSAALLLLLSYLAFSQARSFEEWDSDESAVELYDQSEEPDDLGRRGRGHCQCCDHGCWCHGYDGGLLVSITMMLDETTESRTAQVAAYITVGKAYFEKKFDVDKVDDFCEKVKGEEICFDFIFRDQKPKTTDKLKGCVRLTKPKVVNLGCFGLPLLESDDYDESEIVDSDELYFE